MWIKIITDAEIAAFMEVVSSFHDSCLKEIKYLSGAFVDNDRFMYPVNDCRLLRVLIQRQSDINSVIELEFSALKYMRLSPYDESYTCEIFDSSMVKKDGYIYWWDSADVPFEDIDGYDGTIICAKGLHWRSLDYCLGSHEIYTTQL